jgi:hypothetical protein
MIKNVSLRSTQIQIYLHLSTAVFLILIYDKSEDDTEDETNL